MKKSAVLHFRHRIYNITFAIMIIVIFTSMLGAFDGNGAGMVEAMKFDAAKIKDGQVWRLVSYNFLPGADIFGVIMRVLVLLWFIWPVERRWGSPCMLFCYALALLGPSLAALAMNVHLAGGWVPETAMFLIFGLYNPHVRILFMFLLPVSARILGALFAGGYMLISLNAPNMSGVPNVVGFSLAMIYFRWETGIPVFFWLKRRVSRKVKAPDDPAQLLQAVSGDRLEKKVQEIVNVRMFEDAITHEERLITEEFIQRIDPGKELCSADPDAGEDGMCPACRKMGICLRRFLEGKKDATRPTE
jgi:hypothetical protein